MKEYINDILYEGSGLIVGTNKNKTSFIFGQKQSNEWVVLGREDIHRVEKSIANKEKSGTFNDFSYRLYKDGLLLNQADNTIYLNPVAVANFASR